MVTSQTAIDIIDILPKKEVEAVIAYVKCLEKPQQPIDEPGEDPEIIQIVRNLYKNRKHLKRPENHE